MAAATVNRERTAVFGNKWARMADVTFANVGDTYNTKLRILDSWHVESAGVNGIGATVVGGVLTCTGNSGAANILAIGN